MFKQMINLDNKILYHTKIAILGGVIIACLGLLVVGWQQRVIQVSAQVIPVTVSTNHLQFGTVFPGEELEESFVVEFDGEEIVDYRILQHRKPLGEDHPEYPDGGDPEMPGYYRNLCPFLDKISREGEGDTEGETGSARVSLVDRTDTWHVEFHVPAILGQVAQDHTGGFVSIAGEYGCDIVVDVGEEFIKHEVGGSSTFLAGGSSTLFPTNRSGETPVPVVLGESGEPNLTISKRLTNAEFANPGQGNIEFEIIITNNGNLTAFEVMIIDQLPDGFFFDSTERTTQVWVPGDIAPDEVRTIHYLVEAVDAILPGEYENKVEVSALNHEPVKASADIEVREVSVLGMMQEKLEETGFSLRELVLILILIISLSLLAQTLKTRKQY